MSNKSCSTAPWLEKSLAEEDTTANENLILAMIYTGDQRSRGRCHAGKVRVSGETNTISDNKASIRQRYSDSFRWVKRSQEKKALIAGQPFKAYNFGKDYIDYVAKHGGTNSLELARAYSRDVVAPSLGNVTGETYLYLHPILF